MHKSANLSPLDDLLTVPRVSTIERLNVGNTIPRSNCLQNQTEHGIPLPETLELIATCFKQIHRPKWRKHGKAFL